MYKIQTNRAPDRSTVVMKTLALIFLVPGLILAFVPIIRHWSSRGKDPEPASTLDDFYLGGWMSIIFDFFRASWKSKSDRIIGAFALALLVTGIIIELS